MNEWRKVKLGEIAKIKGGKRLPKGTSLQTKKNSHPYIRIKDMTSLKNIELNQNFEYVPDEIFKNIKNYLVNKNDIILSIVGTIGLINKIGSSLNGANLTENCVKITIKDNIITDYLYYYLISIKGQKEIKKGVVGAVQPKLPIKNIEKIKIKYPFLNIQKKISKFLSDIDEKIEINNKINDNLEKQCITIFKKIFPQIFYGNFNVGNYLKPKRGKNLLSKDAILGDFPVVAGGLEPATYHNKSNTKSPVITISASGANAGFIRLWHIPVWSSDSSYIDYSVSKYIYFWYIFLKLRQNEIYDLQSGSAQPHIYPKHLEELSINELNIKSVENFNEITSSFFEKIGKNNIENQKLNNLKNYLLPKLMNGEIDVEKIEL